MKNFLILICILLLVGCMQKELDLDHELYDMYINVGEAEKIRIETESKEGEFNDVIFTFEKVQIKDDGVTIYIEFEVPKLRDNGTDKDVNYIAEYVTYSIVSNDLKLSGSEYIRIDIEKGSDVAKIELNVTDFPEFRYGKITLHLVAQSTQTDTIVETHKNIGYYSTDSIIQLVAASPVLAVEAYLRDLVTYELIPIELYDKFRYDMTKENGFFHKDEGKFNITEYRESINENK